MFDICIVSRTPERELEGWDAVRGEVRLGAYREGFRSPLGPWAPDDYERQWREAAGRLLAGQPAAFWTVPWQFWWAAWPEGEAVVFQEHLLTEERLGGYAHGPEPPAGYTPYELVGPRESVSEDGDPVSEWRLPLAAVRAWLAGPAPAPALA